MREFKRTIFFRKNYYTFLFHKISTSDSEKYFVSAWCKKETATFDVIRDPEGSWRVVPPVPEWIEETKSELIKLIEESSSTTSD